LLLSCVYEQKAAVGDLDAIKILQSTSPVAWRNVHLISNFNFTDGSSRVDIEDLLPAIRTKTSGDAPCPKQRTRSRLCEDRQFYLFEALGKNSLIVLRLCA